MIKVESPEGDDTRRWGPPFVDHDGERTAAYFHGTNRGKTLRHCRFPHARGAATLVRELVADADIVIENFKVGGLAKYGLDYASLSAVNPRLIYCSITGFGQDGPYAAPGGLRLHHPGHVRADVDHRRGRTASRRRSASPSPTSSPACMPAPRSSPRVHQRQTTGQGQQIDMALFDCAVAVMANQAMNYLTTGTPPTRIGNTHPNLTPYQVFDCADGYIIIATGNDAQYRRLCAVLGMPDLADHPDFVTNADRVANRDRLTGLLTAATILRTRADLLAACEAHGIPAGPINDMAQVFADPQIVHRGMQVDLDGVPGMRTPIRLSDGDTSPRGPAPRQGKDG